MRQFSQVYECGECEEVFFTQIAKNLHWDKEHSELEF